MIQNTFQRLIVKFLKNVGVFSSGNGASRSDDKGAFNCKRGGLDAEWRGTCVEIQACCYRCHPVLQMAHFL